MPNRVIREGFLDSEKINNLTEEEQNFFVRLMLITDDYGRFEARSELIRSRCYPVSGTSPSLVSNMLTCLEKVGLITLYSVEGKNYLEIIQYNQRLRQKREKFPPPCKADDSNVRTDDSKVSVESNPKESETKPIKEKEQKISPDGGLLNREELWKELLIPLKAVKDWQNTMLQKISKAVEVGYDEWEDFRKAPIEELQKAKTFLESYTV